MSKHTPGPWQALELPGQYRILVKGGSDRDIALVSKALRSEGETSSNARLIAAAPDLLEACKATLPLLLVGVASDASIDALQAAIKKAEGKE